MTQKRAWALGVSAVSMLISLGIIGAGCAEEVGPDDEETTGATVASSASSGAGGGQGGAGGEGGTGGQACVPSDEVCDGADNNCDQMVDEGCECVPGETRACYTGPENTEGIGDCLSGVQVCNEPGVWSTECGDQVLPGDEKCDSLDNDCNGEVDDNIGTTTCGVGACQVAVPACTEGKPTPCTALPPKQEVCDGLDNDCDQLTDETDPQAGKTCATGLQGACSAGKWQCKSGAIACVAAKSPVSEVCDSVDNNCDGQVDNNIPGTGSSCTSGLPGVCSLGTVQCKSNKVDCFPNNTPSDEICDGLDNDCDDVTDEDNPQGGNACATGIPGICATGIENCIDGALSCTPDFKAVAEVCDGLDNNCDGAVDDSNPGGGSDCQTGLQGLCAQGVKNCVNGAIECTPNVLPSTEVCDAVDNDCDGQKDENNPGGGAACTTSLPGICAAGTVTCQAGALACKQNAQPAMEICNNGLDDNCDGVTDPVVVEYFAETFADNSKGWTTDASWSIGAATASTGHSYGGPDPGTDHSPSADNGIAGVVIGGNASTTVSAARYLTSPAIDTSTASTLYLEFWRWLNSDYSPFMINNVEVYNGTTWIVVWQSGGSPGVQDNAWNKQSFDISAHKNAAMKLRFGYSVGSGAFTTSQWNVDDIRLVSAQCN